MSVIFFIFGLIVGSFLNVVVYRLKTAESIVFGRSHCPKCKSQISWYDNIPLLSFVLLKFRCRNCEKKISWQYPIVEFFSGILFFLVGYNFFILENLSSWLPTFYYLIVTSILLAIFIYDLLYMEIPMILIWIGVAVVVIFNLIIDLGNGFVGKNFLEVQSLSGLTAAFLAWIFFFSLAYGSKEKWMGMGDSFLAIFLGLFLGLENIFYALVIGFSLGAILGIGLVLFKKKAMQSQLPLAPFLIFGTLAMLFWGKEIINWHLGLFY